MKTQEEIEAKLKWLTAQRPNFIGSQLVILNADIKRLMWVLNRGEDVILVPKPQGRITT